MESLDRLNQAIAYIEENLNGEIDFQVVEQIALCSEYHFRRMFSYLAGVSLSEYIRRRRLTQAAFELIVTERQVIDIALKYGYTSPDAFTRAFNLLHGITPTEARKTGQSLTAYPQMKFQLTINGVTDMNYRIIEKDEFRIFGIMKRVPLIYHGVNPEITSMVEQLTEETIESLKALSNIEPSGIISASTNFSESRLEGGELDHYIGVATTHDTPNKLSKLQVPASTWAVFESVGPFPETLQNTWGRIYSEWFPTSNYQQSTGPEIVWHESNDVSLPNYRSEIWIPVKQKP